MVMCVKSPFVVILGQIIVPVGLCMIKIFRGGGVVDGDFVAVNGT